jgi:hypothetical protein
MQLATEGGDPDMLLEAHHAMWVTHFFRGDIGEAGRHIDRGLEHYDREQHHAHVMLYGQDAGVVGLSYRALVHQAQGSWSEADRLCREATALGRSLGHPVSLNFAIGFTGWVQMERGNADGCRTHCGEVMQIATTHGLPFWQAHTVWILGRARAAESIGDGLREMRAGIDALDAIGARMGIAGYLGKLARAELEAGNRDEARRLAGEARAIGDADGELLGRAELLELLGDLEMSDRGGADAVQRASRHYRDAIDVARRQESTLQQVSAAIRLFRLGPVGREEASATALLAEALERCPAADPVPPLVAEARALLAGER